MLQAIVANDYINPEVQQQLGAIDAARPGDNRAAAAPGQQNGLVTDYCGVTATLHHLRPAPR
jgi:hypothetical protein